MVTTYASSCPLQYLVASQLCENHRTDPDQEFLLPEATTCVKLISKIAAWQKSRDLDSHQSTNIAVLPFNSSLWSWPSRMCDVLKKICQKLNFQSWICKLNEKHVHFGPLSMPRHGKIIVGNNFLGTWSSSCPPPGVKLTSFKVNNWLQFDAISEKWREAHQEIIVRGAGLGLVASAGHHSRPLHPLPLLLHQDQLQVITFC